MVGREAQRALGVLHRAGAVARLTPGGRAQNEDLDIVGSQGEHAIEIGDGGGPGLAGRVGEAAVDQRFGIARLQFDGAAVRGHRPVGVAGLEPRLARLCPELGPQARTFATHIAGDRFELCRRLREPAGLEHRHGHAVAGAIAATLGEPALGGRNGFQRILPRMAHALGIALEVVGLAAPLRDGGTGDEQQPEQKCVATIRHAAKQARSRDAVQMARRLFVFGLGFSGLAVARRARALGWSVGGSCTGADKARRLAAEGIDAVVFDSSTKLALDAASHILSTVAPLTTGDPVVDRFTTSARPEWLGYLSTTGVYGDAGGGWVDEDSPALPTQARSQRRLDAEHAWQRRADQMATPLHRFRLPGIYGPGRSALDQVRAGTARRIDRPGQVFSRIHVEDIASAVLASMAAPAAPPGRIYNVADDLPAAPAEIVAEACRLLDVPAPPLVPFAEAAPQMSEMARSFYAESRRVRAERIKRELGVVWRYPTYREGLAAIADATR